MKWDRKIWFYKKAKNYSIADFLELMPITHNSGLKPLIPPLFTLDKTPFCIQASRCHFCIPRNDRGPYTHVEIELLKKDANPEWEEYILKNLYNYQTITYAYVPLPSVQDFIVGHGGLDMMKSCLNIPRRRKRYE